MFYDNITIAAPAKINLALDVLEKEPNGYHQMSMINHSCTLCDYLRISKSDEFCLNGDTMGLAEDNLITKAVNLMREYTGIETDFKIDLDKRIPERAGLAGGSADAAATLKLVNFYKDLNLTKEELEKLAARLGADVPYCLYNIPALVEGIGERITPLDTNLKSELLIVSPEIKISTPEAFSWVDNSRVSVHNDREVLIKRLKNEDLRGLRSVANNTFIPAVSAYHPEISQIIDKFYTLGAAFSTMSGSGSSVVGYFDDTSTRDKAAESFADYRTFKTKIV